MATQITNPKTVLFTTAVSSTGGATSRGLSTIGAGNYGAMSSNSVSLAAGTWEIHVTFQIQAGTGTGIIIDSNSGLYAANGADNSTQPATLSTIGTVAGPAIFAEYSGSIPLSQNATGFGQSGGFTTYLTISGTQTVYAVPRIDFSTAGTSAVRVYILARKIY